MTDLQLHELIGPARRVAEVLLAKCGRLADLGGDSDSGLRLLLNGPPGTGKSAVALLVGRTLVERASDLVLFNGTKVTIDVVDRIHAMACSVFLWHDWHVTVINEIDKIPPAAQVLMLDVLDELKPHRAIIGTTNLGADQLGRRLMSRFQQFEIGPPSEAEITGLLMSRCQLPLEVAAMIATGARGDVRLALNDAHSYLDRIAV